ncbi:MAG: HlyD family efflux transporter periplasmic adaptor subunit [Saprospiraceae bacterium]
MKLLKILIPIITVIFFVSCSDDNNKSDAYGNFEATEIMVSSEMPGKLLFLNVEEGMTLKNDQQIGLIDTTLLEKQKNVVKASINAINSKTQNQKPEIDVLNEQKAYVEQEKNRLVNLLGGGAATQKQLDDINSQIDVFNKKISATKSKYAELNRGILAQKEPLVQQLKQIQEQIDKSKIKNPIDGTVLTVYKRAGEVTGAGIPLYKIADLSYLNLKAYISGDQLPHVKLNQKVKVLIDDTKTTNRSLDGEITWISSQAEFTPKTIQTKEERVNQVYAIKVKVINDGSLKIGMPGEIRFNTSNNDSQDSKNEKE